MRRICLEIVCSVAVVTAWPAWAGTGTAREKTKGETQEMTTPTQHAHTNRLVDSTSPYLLQHAHNPVDWYPWCAEAFAKAAKENKPIFLSIGYAACHWCHVMEHESFEDEQIAAVLNQHCVAIKVDREERPDVDEIYMRVTMALNKGHGGWPMSVFMTPDKVPFFAGTYFPPQQFTALLNRIIDAWQNNRQEVTSQSQELRDYVQRWARGPDPAADLISRETVDQAARTMAQYFDDELGGISGGGTNKFPPSMAMELMLRVHNRGGDDELLRKVELTLDHMARGGILLYDQALVSSIYLDAYQATGKRRYAEVAADIFDYVLADLQSPEGGFYSTRDADSEGLEGAYYIWTVEQVTDVLGPEDGKLFCDFYDVTPRGNWFESRGHAPAGPKNILHIPVSLEEYAGQKNLDPAELERRLASMRAKLLEVRTKRVPPGLDDKVLTAWNGLMIASMAKGARVLDAPKYATAAAGAADFVLSRMRTEGRLLRSYREGKANLTGYLSDYAFMIDGLLNLYEATFERKWLDQAASLTEALVAHYYDEENGGFFFTADDAEELLARTKNPRDGAIPSGNSVAAMNLLRMAILLDRKDLREKAESIFRAFKPMVERSPSAFERLLCAADFLHGRPKEIALAGDPNDPTTKELIGAVYSRFLPNKVVALAADESPAQERAIPLLVGKKRIKGRPTAYVCENFRCQAPVTSAQELARQLAGK
ncbi:MAG: thioredoxin domain-containing protein [Planctomycetota bacterium]|jgi:uncharacterized protein YyaL (SSP411 family)